MKSLITYISLSLFLLTASLKFHWNAPPVDFSTQLNSALTCPNPCQTGDSLALVAIFNATQGFGWTNTWNLNQPVCTPWPGIELDNDGYVIRITLDNNNLIGGLPPEIGNFSRLEELQLNNNSLNGNIPPQIGNLSNIELCFLDDNNFTGTIPEEFGNLSVMITLYLDNNNLVGAVPISFLNLTNLFKFDLFNNQIDSIPDLSSINLQPNRFRVYNNNLTFDDIVLNNPVALGDHYYPQDSVNQAQFLTLQTGTSYTLDLGFDSAIPDNSYQWFKNGVPFGTPTNSNKLVFSPVDWSDAGVYRAQVTNPNAPLLTLHTRPVTININCGVSVYEISDTLCFGEEMEFNDIIYDEDNPDGFELLNGQDQYGCDSIIEINLTFREANIVELDDIICTTDSIIVNGTVYNQGNPDGTEIFSLADQYGCDSIVEIDLSFYSVAAAGNLSPTICPGDSIELFGVFYSQTNNTGTVVLNNATGTGCDSTIFIEVLFYAPATGVYYPTVCEGGTINFGGENFNAANPSGQVNLGAIAQYGCDSIVNVTLGFYGPAEGTYEDDLCFGDSVIVNNTVYNQGNPSGFEMFPNGSANQCDSIVFVNLTFNSNITEFINPTLCPGDSIIANGQTYNQLNPSGIEMITGGSSSGCDSTVNVNLSFHPLDESNYSVALCAGDSTIINGTIYNQNNLTGTEVFSSNITGCDSIVHVNINILQGGSENIDLDLCDGDSIIVNSIVYNEANPTGTEIIPNPINGCDSIVQIDLNFSNQYFTVFNPSVCADSSFLINNITYNISNPTGTEIMQTVNGCDSIIDIDINYYPNTPNFINDVLCAEQGRLINGTVYNQNNPSGTETIENGTVNGCDSIIVIDLTFIPEAEGLLNPTLCSGDSVVINGVVYDQDNPTGIQYFEGEAASGCDSLVNIDLSFYSPTPYIYSDLFCPGDSIIINGTTYNENNPNGTELLENGSADGCDSIVIVSLIYIPTIPTLIDDVLCENDEIMVNNQSYNIGNPNGVETMTGANGCDSVVIIGLTFNNEVQFTLDPSLCPGDSVVVNGVIYNQNNPFGSETFLQGSVTGCDSIVFIDLNYYNVPVELIETTLCETDSVMVNNVKYDFVNPTGTETIVNGSSNGCDSIVEINLSFHSVASGMLSPTICQGESFNFNGSTFDVNIPSGSVTLENGSSNGCDSTVFVELSFFDPAQGNLSPTICQGESFDFNGSTFDANTPSGSVILENASSNGCDSIVEVTVNFSDAIIFETAASICEGNSFEIAGETFSQIGSYEILLENGSVQGCDSLIILNLTTVDPSTLGLADAGDDIEQCENFVNLNANLPPGSTGNWISLNGLNIDNPQNNSIEINNLQAGTYSFAWSLSNGQCFDYHSDTVKVFIQAAPEAIDDTFLIDLETSLAEFDFLENDNISNTEEWTFELLTEPSTGTISEISAGVYQFERTNPLDAEVVLEYQLCHEDCTDLCSTAFVTIKLERQNIDNIEIPNAITPNGDGVNELFMFPQLEFQPDIYPDKELIIFNRWGDIIFQAEPYLNNWSGKDKNGNDLPQGTYYFVLRLDIAEGIILKGDVSILR